MGDGSHGPIYLEIAPTGDPRGFALVGELDMSTAPSLQSALAPEISLGGDITLDLGRLTFMDSIGLQTIIRTARDLDGRGRLILVHPGNLVRSLLKLGLGMNRIPNLIVVGEEGAL